MSDEMNTPKAPAENVPAKAADPKPNKKMKYPTKKLAKNEKDKKNFFVRAGASIAKWFREMRSELKKVVWPTRKQIMNNTLVSLAVMFVFAVIVWGFDRVASLAVQLLITLTN